ncbi:MAG: bifunctional riboflavin kinase/FAD synthetase [Candidatus Omnitrophica bacterium]|nr:bifunctional riboflavin kinase/FAD synthetase [Candidatus Omnitrophota bacterium]
MKVISGHPTFPALRYSGLSISHRKIPCLATIGVFDGIHTGHQRILREVTKESRRQGVASLVITFDIPPQVILKKHFDGCISTLKEKERLLKAQGIEYVWFLTTTSHLLKLSADEFLRHIFKYFTITTLFVGEGFAFGYKAKTGIESLMRLSKKYHFDLVVVRKHRLMGKIVSSSLIRECIGQGKFTRVKKFLGRDYTLEGNVVRGRGIGVQLKFPTANIETGSQVIPKKGVYAGIACVGTRTKLAAINIGTNPTVGELPEIVVEAHLIGFNKNIFGRNIKIFFLQRLRKEKKFSSQRALRDAIAHDIKTIIKKYPLLYKKYLNNKSSLSSKCSTPSLR